VGVAQLRVPCDSPAVFESKSLKLYLGSFSQTPFAGASDVARTLEKDLSATVGAPVAVDLLSLGEAQQAGIGAFTGACLDTLQIAVSDYRPNPDLLRTDPGRVVAGEALYSNLLHSLCPVTGQPDAGSIQVVYSGARIDHASLLRYIVSYREHQAFHEQCVESIFLDITARCRPSELTVYARYNRRGGIDINPYRSTGKSLPAHMRLARQ
jgi:7-cyano-7-deazaguanine reductase